VVLDNTYLTRALRSYVIDAAARHGVPARCVWLNTPLAQAQVNLVTRLLEQNGTLPSPDELRRGVPGVMAPTSQMRALRELEAPAPDEGFAQVEIVEFARAARPGEAGVFVAASAVDSAGEQPTLPHLIFDWRPDGSPDALSAEVAKLAARVSAAVEGALCPHGGGPPRCWCRPPLPGLPLTFAHAHGVDPARCTLIGTSAAHRTMATALGARYVAAVG
jgi:hypothetical protein